MAISHVCTGCGLDLAPQRAAPEPHYGLPVVVCRACGTASVRHRRAETARRARRRLRHALGLLTIQLAAVFLIGLLMGVWCVGIGKSGITLLDAGRDLMDRLRGTGAAWPSPAAGYAAFAVFSAVAGLWLTVAFEHLGVVGAIARWALLLQAAVLVLPLVLPVSDTQANDTVLKILRDRVVEGWLERASAAAQCALLAFAGVPLGLRLRSTQVTRYRRLSRGARARRRWARPA